MKIITKVVSSFLAILIVTSALTTAALSVSAVITPTAEDAQNIGQQLIYFEYPTDGTWGDASKVTINDFNQTANVYCMVYAIYGNEYEFFESGWETSVCACKVVEGKPNVYSYDLNSTKYVRVLDPLTGKKTKKPFYRFMEENPDIDYGIIFSTSNGVGYQTADLNMNSDCIGDTVALVTPYQTRENASNSAKIDYFSKWKNHPQFETKANIGSLGTFFPGQFAAHEPRAKMLADKLKDYLTNPINFSYFNKVDNNKALCDKIGTTPLEVYNQYKKDNSLFIKAANIEPANNDVPVDFVRYMGKNINGEDEEKKMASLKVVQEVLGLSDQDVLSQETLGDNSTLTLLKNAQKSGKTILNDYGAGDTAKVITFDILTNLFDLVAEQITVDFGGDTPEDKALDEVTQNIMKDYFGYNGLIEEQKLNSINEKWNCFKTAVKAVKKLRTQKKEGEAKKLAKTTIKQLTKKGDSFGDKVINGFSKVSPYIDGAFTYYEIAMTAAMLQEFDKATVESLLNTFPKNTLAYTGLQRLHHDMTTSSDQYIIEKFTQEAIITALSEFLEELTFQGNEGLKEAYSSASGILSLVYEMSGGATMKDISRARSAVAIAGNAYSLLATNSDSGKREMIFNFCLSSIKVELENCIKVCKSSSASLKSSAQKYQSKVNKLTYEKYIKDCANEYNNPQGVTFENPNLDKHEISAKNTSNNKALSLVGATEDEVLPNENELIIPSSTEDYMVTSISENGFANLEGITTIYVPNSIENIGDSAFYNCVDTQSITLGNNVTCIGEKAFMNCSALSSINLSANLTTIKESAFEYCSGLTGAVLSKALSELGDKAFANCESLSTVFVFNPTLVIPDVAFENCGNLTIYGYAGSTAEEYANLHNIQFENIGDSTTGIKVNYNGEPTVEHYGSVNADNISLDITYNDGKTETITDGFAVACDTSSVGKKNAVVICGSVYATFEVDVVNSVPTEINFEKQNYNMVIGDRLNPNVTLSPESTDYQVALTSSDESVISIEGDSIVAVGEGNAEITASTGDGNLSASCSVSVGNNRTIDCSDGLFDPIFFVAPRSEIYRFTIISDNTMITILDQEGNVLKNAESQNGYLSFTELLKKNEIYILYVSANKSQEVIINPTLNTSDSDNWKNKWNYTVLDDDTLEVNYIAKDISTPDSATIDEPILEIPREIDGKPVSSIADSAFEDCSSAKLIIIPDTVNNIGMGAFRNCSNLESLFVPDSVKNIDEYAFSNCTKLKSISLPHGITSISFGEFDGCRELTEINLPQNIERIEGYAFHGCKNLTEILLPDNISFIGWFAFYNCNLTSIRIPKTVNYLGDFSVGFMDDIDGIENFIIYGYKGTVAETYAKTRQLTFVALDNEQKIGDINGDEVVNVKDRIYLSRYLAKWADYDSIDEKAADVNADGTVDAKDRIILARYLAKWEGYDVLPYKMYIN